MTYFAADVWGIRADSIGATGVQRPKACGGDVPRRLIPGDFFATIEWASVCISASGSTLMQVSYRLAFYTFRLYSKNTNVSSEFQPQNATKFVWWPAPPGPDGAYSTSQTREPIAGFTGWEEGKGWDGREGSEKERTGGKEGKEKEGRRRGREGRGSRPQWFLKVGAYGLGCCSLYLLLPFPTALTWHGRLTVFVLAAAAAAAAVFNIGCKVTLVVSRWLWVVNSSSDPD